MRLSLLYVLLILILMLIVCAVALGGDIDRVIAPPTESPQSGQEAEISVYVNNNGVRPFSVNFPDRITLLIKSESAGNPIETFATAAQPLYGKSPVLERGAFVKARYAFTVPPELEGPVRLEIAEFDKAFVMFRIAPSLPPKISKMPDTSVGVSEPPEKHATMDKIFARRQPFLDNFSAYKPLYFLVGTETDKSKFQLSFKYRFLNPGGGLIKEYRWLNGMHFGYTQTSFWDLKSESAPFKDTSYKPELFFVSPNLTSRPSWLDGLIIQTGFQHESNGRDGNDSRSTNFLYVKPMFNFHDPGSRYFLEISPKVWAYIGNDDMTNPDLPDYRGYFELEIKLGKDDGLVLGSNFRWGSAGASVEADLTYPIRKLIFNNVDLFFHVQYVNVLAERLINFRERTEALRIGFSLVR